MTRKDVARYAGVSTAVVSYVVNSGPKRVAPATEARVLEAVRVLGYRPNGAARALSLGSTELLGLVMPDNTNAFYAELAHAVEQAANEMGYAVLLTNSDSSGVKERKHARNLVSRRVDGLLLTSSTLGDDPELEQIRELGIPTVLLDQERPHAGVPSVGVDLSAGARTAVEHLISHGHTNIALVVGIRSYVDGREEGWSSALFTADLQEGGVYRAAFSREGGYLAGKRITASRDRPTAVFVSSDAQAVGVLLALQETGIRVPEDIAVATFDGSLESKFSWPPLTTIQQPIHAMAEAALKKLFEKNTQTDEEHTLLPTELIIRRSCGCISV